MNVSKSKDYRIGFRVGTWDLERLAQLLGGDELVTGLSVEMADGSSYLLEHVGELQTVDNAPGRQIRAVTMESAPPAFLFGGENPARLALVTVRDGPYDTVRYHVSGPAQVVDRLTRELDDWVTSLRPWYSSLSVMDRPRFLLWTAALIGTLALLVQALYLTLGGSTSPGGASVPGRVAWLATAGGLIVVTAVAAILNVRRGRFLPVASFHIGQGTETSERVDRKRMRLLRASIGAATLAVAASIVGAFLA